MRLRFSLLMSLAAAALMVVPATASAYFVHVVAPGETLSSIAAADGLGVDQLAAANGLSPTAQLISGETIQIPPQQSSIPSGVAAPTSAAVPVSSTSSGGAYVVQPGDTLTAIAARAGLSTRSLAADNGLGVDDILVSGTVLHLSGGAGLAAPSAAAVPVSATTSSGGAYVVQPGDTLTAIAERAGVSPASLASANGLEENGVLISGKVIHLAGSPAAVVSSAATSQPVGEAAQGSPVDPPYPTAERVSGVGGRLDRGRQRRPGLARRRDRVAGERVQQRPGLERRRARRDADPARNLAVDPAVARQRRRLWRPPRRQTTSAAVCSCSTRC